MKSSGEMLKGVKIHVVNLEGRTFIEEGIYIARCDSLGISDHGDTEQEAIENLGKTLGLFVRSCLERGTFESFLKKRGVPSIEAAEQEDEDDRMMIPLVLLSYANAGAGGNKRGMSG